MGPARLYWSKMKLLRFLTIATLLAGFTVAQVPTPAKCQMALGLPSLLCAMPCCKTPAGIPVQCPLVRPGAHQEAITPSSHIAVSGMELAATWGAALVSGPVLKASYLRSTVETFTSLLLSSRPIGRAPPLEYILFSA